MGFVKLLIAWALTMAIYPSILVLWFPGPKRGFGEAILGMGVLLAIPTMVFALVAGWPTMSWLAGLRLGWPFPFVAAAAFALLMGLLAMAMLPDSWNGARLALVGYAAVLGLVWACLHLAMPLNR